MRGALNDEEGGGDSSTTSALRVLDEPKGTALPDLYDERPYTDHAYAETHPARVAAVARLSGWAPPPVGSARVLELGCGRGGNLLPMAAGLPGASLVGVDRSGRQIAEARRIAGEVGLANVTLIEAGFEGVALEDGAFDYVVCHGVLSWVPAGTRAVLLGRIARALGDRGVACVSFNVLPGWYDRLAARDWLRFAASALGHRPEDAASSLAWLGAQVSPEEAGARRRLDAVAQRLAETGPAYAFHEYLSPEHHPMLVGSFLAEAAAAGLTYLGDALPATTAIELLPDEARERALSLDPVAAQQLVDFVRCTAFRRALLVRSDRVRGWSAPRTLDSGALRSLRVGSRLRAQRPPDAGARQEEFAGGDLVVQVNDPRARVALHALERAAPRVLLLDELTRGDHDGLARVAAELFDLWLATGAVDLYDHDVALTSRAEERPVACPVARWHALHGGAITSRLHQEVLVPDAIVREVSRARSPEPSGELGGGRRGARGARRRGRPPARAVRGARPGRVTEDVGATGPGSSPVPPGAPARVWLAGRGRARGWRARPRRPRRAALRSRRARRVRGRS